MKQRHLASTVLVAVLSASASANAQVVCNGGTCDVYPTRQHHPCTGYLGNQTACQADEFCTWTGSTCIGSTTSYTENWYVGMAYVDGVLHAVACLDELGTTLSGVGTGSSDNIFILGPATGLDHDYVIHGEPYGAPVGSTDTMHMVPRSSYDPRFATSYCYRDTSPPLQGITSSWSPLLFNGHSIQLRGEYGDDWMDNGFSSSVASMDGGAGTDSLRNISWLNTTTAGGAGGDRLCSTAPTATHSLLGGADQDCLSDAAVSTYQSGAASGTLDCGPSFLDGIALMSGVPGGDIVSCEIGFTPRDATSCACDLAFTPADWL